MTKHTILFLAANPLGTDRLALDREARAIQVELERSGDRDRFEFVTRWAAEPLDLLRALRKLKPTVVHFSGHGDGRGEVQSSAGPRRDIVGVPGAVDGNTVNGDPQHGLFFQGPDGRLQLVSTAALQETFGAAGSSVKLVVLNACYSEVQAEALLAHVGCVVGMRGSIRDAVARSFAIGFYGGLGESESVGAAFRQGVAAIRLEELLDDAQLHHATSPAMAQCDSIVKLLTPLGADPSRIYIVNRAHQKRRCSIVIRANLEEFDAEVITRVRDQLRLLTGDVSLEIIEVKEGSVRLTVVLSPEAAMRLESLNSNGQLHQICGFDVSSVRVHEASDIDFEDRSGDSSQAPTQSDAQEIEPVGAQVSRAPRRANLPGANFSESKAASSDDEYDQSSSTAKENLVYHRPAGARIEIENAIYSPKEVDNLALQQLPILPLPNCVLLPGGLLPLHVFEKRYRDMTRDCLAGHQLMGVARLRPGFETSYYGRPPVYEKCGVGRIICSEELPDGRFALLLRGVARAEIARELPSERNYRLVEARTLDDASYDPTDAHDTHRRLISLCDRLAEVIEQGGAQLRDLVRSFDSPGACADAVAAALVMDADARQELLEARDPMVRLQRTLGHVSHLLDELAPKRREN